MEKSIAVILFLLFLTLSVQSITYLSNAYAQGLKQPKPVDPKDRLKVSYLGRYVRGSKVTILFMSGKEKTGKLMNVKQSDGVVVLELNKKRVGSYKVTTIAGIERNL